MPGTEAAKSDAANPAKKQLAAKNGVVPAAGARAAALPAAKPSQLVGMGGDDVQGLLGLPFLLKREGAAELWQYRAANCVLDVFLYPGDGGNQRVTHTELRARRENGKVPAGCYAEILNAPRPPPQQTAKS